MRDKRKAHTYWPNLSISTFNRHITHENPFVRRDAPDSTLQFSWDRRGLPIRAFTYETFMSTANKLIELAEKYRGIVDKEVYGFRVTDDHNTARVLGKGLANGEIIRGFLKEKEEAEKKGDKEVAEYAYKVFRAVPDMIDQAQANREGVKFRKFNPTVYEGMRDCSLSITDPKTEKHFMMCLGTFDNNRRLQFYGQCLGEELFRETVRRFHKIGLTYYLS